MGDGIELSFLRVLELACDVQEDETFFSGILRSENLLIKFEDELHRLGMKFSVKCRSKRVTPGSAKAKRILFEYKSEHKVPFLGHPFTIEDTLYKDCHLGGRERTSSDQQKVLTSSFQQYSEICEQLIRSRITKKQGCEATFVIKKVHVYEGIEVARGENKESALQKVKSGDYNTSCWFCFQISKPDFHNHNFGEATQRSQPIHPHLVERIKELVRDGVRKADNIKNILEEYVKSEVLKDSLVTPTPSNASYFPSTKAIRNAVCRVIQLEKYHKIDQEVLAKLLWQWNSEHIYYRPYVIASREGGPAESDCVEDYAETFLLVYQTAWQRKILNAYGRNICILDAAFKTIKYGIPLYFLSIKTNIGYMVAATFVVQFETTSSLLEALQLIRKWNPEWLPRYFLFGTSKVELDAVDRAFPESECLICDFHREQSWLRWLHKSGNVTLGTADKLFDAWQNLATSPTREIFESSASEMEISQAWMENKNVQSYFMETWMPIAGMWVHFNRSFDFKCCITLNNGYETMDKFLQHTFLLHYVNKTISNFLRVIFDTYLPDQMRSYIRGNLGQSDNEQHWEEVSPEWLQNRPHSFVRHVLTRWSSASNEYHHIVQDDPNTSDFSVKSSSEDFAEETWCSVHSYHVEISKPSCTCQDFNKWFYPCKHMCAVLIFVPNVSLEGLPSRYLDSPYLSTHQSLLHELQAEFDSFKSETHKSVNCIQDPTNCKQQDHSYQQQSLAIPTQSFLVQDKGTECREILQEMMSLTHLVNDTVLLDKVIQNLQSLLKDLSAVVVVPSHSLTFSPNCLLGKRTNNELCEQSLINKRTKAII